MDGQIPSSRKAAPGKALVALVAPSRRIDLELEAMPPITLEELKARLIAEWDAEFEEDIEVIRVAPDLATMLEQTNSQANGLLWEEPTHRCSHFVLDMAHRFCNSPRRCRYRASHPSSDG